MSDLKELIQSINNWRSKTASQIAAELNTPSITVRNPNFIRYATIESAYGLQTMLDIRAAIRNVLNSGLLSSSQQNMLDYANVRLESDDGMNLSTDVAQSQLESLRAIPSLAPFVDQIKQLGVQMKSPWTANGFAGQVTEAEVAASLLLIQKLEIIETKRSAFEQWRVQMMEWNGTGDPPVMGG